jgi:hypothetical protein
MWKLSVTWRFCACVSGHWLHTETTPKPGLQHSRTWYHTICFEKLEEWVVYRVLTLMCCFVCGCGPYGWRLDSTFRTWVLTGLETQSNMTYTICFEKLEEWVVYSVLTLMCCFVCGCGPYGWADVWTRRSGSECSLPWHVWIDSRTSVKCEGCSVYREMTPC